LGLGCHNCFVDEEERKEAEGGRNRGLLRMVLVSVGLLALYVLSVGPMMKMCYGRRVDTVGRFYVPLDLLNMQVPAAAHFFDWYVHQVWGVPSNENWFIY